ncbi:MAG: hypothetical protein WBN34_08265, partial [Woeseia sp.]
MFLNRFPKAVNYFFNPTRECLPAGKRVKHLLGVLHLTVAGRLREPVISIANYLAATALIASSLPGGIRNSVTDPMLKGLCGQRYRCARWGSAHSRQSAALVMDYRQTLFCAKVYTPRSQHQEAVMNTSFSNRCIQALFALLASFAFFNVAAADDESAATKIARAASAAP